VSPRLATIYCGGFEALHILDRFHIVAKMNKALDEVRAEETRRMKREGRETHRRSFWRRGFD
jgi:transposase